jgi:hypothetical protein
MAQKQIAPTTHIIKIPIKTESMAFPSKDDVVAHGRRAVSFWGPRSLASFLASTVQRMGFEPCLVSEEPPKRERDLPVLITFGSRRERPGVSQDVAPGLDEIRHFAASVGFRLLYSVRRRHDAPFGSGGSSLLSSPVAAGYGSVTSNHCSVPFFGVVNIAHFSK